MQERGTGMKVEKQNRNIPCTLTCYKDSRPCPTVSQYQLDALVTKIHDTFATPYHPHILMVLGRNVEQDKTKNDNSAFLTLLYLKVIMKQ